MGKLINQEESHLPTTSEKIAETHIKFLSASLQKFLTRHEKTEQQIAETLQELEQRIAEESKNENPSELSP